MFENNLNLTMKIQYWFIMHRILFRRFGILLLMILDIIVVGLAAIGWGNYLSTKGEYEKMLQNIGKQTLIIKQEEANQIVVEQTAFIPGLGNKYDLVALVKNPNSKWLVNNFNYEFVVDGVPVDSGSTFILAGQEKVIAKLSISLEQKPRSVSLSFKNSDVNWSRVKSDTNLGGKLPEFKTSNISWSPIVDQKLAPFSRLTADISNESIDSFWTVNIYALILDASGRIVGVGYQSWDNALGGEKHQILMSWDTIINQGGKVAIYPDVNVTDPTAIKR